MLRAVLFDFNGVIVDDEPVHLSLFQRVLKEEGFHLEKDEYYTTYVGMDDRDCFRSVLLQHQAETTEERLKELIARKARYYRQRLESIPLFSGARECVIRMSKHVPLAIVSGALRSEIVAILECAGLMDYVQVIVSADETRLGKPDPDGYITALELLNERFGRILPMQCLAVEDTVAGIEAVHAAGMKCLAVTNTHSRKELHRADLALDSLEELTWESAASLFQNGTPEW